MSTTREDKSAIANRLIKEIGDYDISEIMPTLNPASEQALYKGCENYRKKHGALIQKYKKSHPNAMATSGNLSHFFRECFINYISNIISSNEPHYENLDDGKTRSTNPESATISLTKFLGSEGKELYDLALQEESASIEFRDSVMRNSTKHFTGKQWSTKPIIVIAGPSSSGKTKAAYRAIQNADLFLSKSDSDIEGNTVVFVDGGIVRETSQIRKLAIQAANANGYSGISDLHDQSSAIDGIKHVVQAAAHHTPYGMVVPLTFSESGLPLIGSFVLDYIPGKKNINKLLNQPNSTPIFCHIKGKDPEKFKQAVEYMGSRRAWKTSFTDDQSDTSSIDLNISSDDICESKAYDKDGFSFGITGSENAEHLFEKAYPNGIRFSLSNDLILVKQDPITQTWIPAKKTDANILLVSEEHLGWWTSLTQTTSQESDKYDTDIPYNAITAWKKLLDNNQGLSPSLKEFVQVAPNRIKTLAEIELDHLMSRIDRHTSNLDQLLIKLTDRGQINEMQDCKENVAMPFLAIYQTLKSIDPRNKNDLASAIIQIEAFRDKHFNQPASPRLSMLQTKATKSRSVYLKKKSAVILESTISILESLLTAVIAKDSRNNAFITPVVAIKTKGFLKEANRKQLTTFIQNQSELAIVNITTQRIDVAYKENLPEDPQKKFTITDDSISTLHKDAALFKTMVTAFLASTSNGKKMRIQAQDQEVKAMMENVLKSLAITSERYQIETPVSLIKAPTLFQTKRNEAPHIKTSVPAIKSR